jgi:hypothetical protein
MTGRFQLFCTQDFCRFSCLFLAIIVRWVLNSGQLERLAPFDACATLAAVSSVALVTAPGKNRVYPHSVTESDYLRFVQRDKWPQQFNACICPCLDRSPHRFHELFPAVRIDCVVASVSRYHQGIAPMLSAYPADADSMMALRNGTTALFMSSAS